MIHVVRAWRTSRTIRFFVLIALPGVVTQAVLSRGSGAVQGVPRQTKMIGSDRLVSIEPLTEMGQICVTDPGDVRPVLMASLQLPQQQTGSTRTSAGANPRRPSNAVRSEVAARKPVSTIRDPRNAFAGLVVDPVRNEVIIAEENNFSLLVYDRMENTPPKAALSEPKRMIQGEKTFLEFACSVYVDPVTGDIYGINNDTLNWMTVFDRNAKGNVGPKRKLHTPHTTFGILKKIRNC